MPGQKLFIGNKHPGFYMDKHSTVILSIWSQGLPLEMPMYKQDSNHRLFRNQKNTSWKYMPKHIGAFNKLSICIILYSYMTRNFQMSTLQVEVDHPHNIN